MTSNCLEELNLKAQHCKKCSLFKTRNKIVFSDGCCNAPVMFIGEAPGKNEDETGIPFVGRAGKLLREFMAQTDFKEGDFYIANTIKCRPPENRKPKDSEKEACKDFLEKQISLVDPSVIVLVGATALESFYDKKVPISKIRGEIFEKNVAGKQRKFIPIFHPSYLLRQHSTEENSPRSLFRLDLIKIKEIISGQK